MLMDEKERTEFLEGIYSKNGLNLSVARLTIGASDYSTRLYTYDDVPFDTELKHFSINKDREYIIPILKEILKIRPDIYFFASPWSPPGWMKTGGELCSGYMRAEFVNCYADYFIKYIKAYADVAILQKLSESKLEYVKRRECDFIPALRSGYREAISVLNKNDELVGYMSFNKEQNHVEEFAFAGEIECEAFQAFAQSISSPVEVMVSGYDKTTYDRLKGCATPITKVKKEPTRFRVVNPKRMQEIALKLGLDKETLFAPYLT